MRSLSLWTSILSLGVVSAFEDASPFFLFSTSRLTNTSFDALNVATSSQIRSSVLKTLENCLSQTYIVVEQPAARLADFANGEAIPTLRRGAQRDDENVLSSFMVQEVKAKVDARELAKSLSKQCNAHQLDSSTFNETKSTKSNLSPAVVSIEGTTLPSYLETRLYFLKSTDDLLKGSIEMATSQGDYTVIYITTPPSLENPSQQTHKQQIYEMEEELEFNFENSEHIELKRDFNLHIRAVDNTSLPLFETYQFLSPGLFMGGFVSLLLILVLYIGINAIAGLEVSYMAFSKEMGPAAQKKQ